MQFQEQYIQLFLTCLIWKIIYFNCIDNYFNSKHFSACQNVFCEKDHSARTHNGQSFFFFLIIFILNLSVLLTCPNIRRSPELFLCAPLQNTAVVPFPQSTSQAGSTHVRLALKLNFSWKMGSSGMWQKDTDQWALFKSLKYHSMRSKCLFSLWKHLLINQWCTALI